MNYKCPQCNKRIPLKTLEAHFIMGTEEIEEVTGICPEHGKIIIAKFDPDDFPTPIACDIDFIMG